MVLEVEKLPDDASKLKEIIVSLAAQNFEKEQYYQSQIDRLYEQIRYLRSKLFGRKTEKYVKVNQDQLRLFDEIEQAASREEDKPEVPVADHTRKKPGRKPLPENLPRPLHNLSKKRFDRESSHLQKQKSLHKNALRP